MPIADMFINDASGHRVISFLDGNASYNQIFMAEEDMSKMAFRCPDLIGLFEWVVMTFGLKNVGTTYQRAMNLIFHDLLGIILEVYIDDVVVKSDSTDQNSDESCNLVSIHPWKLFFDDLACREDQGVGIVLISPWAAIFEQSVRLAYFCINNRAEYEAILLGL
jgi:hypothetical protein